MAQELLLEAEAAEASKGLRTVGAEGERQIRSQLYWVSTCTDKSMAMAMVTS